MRKSIPIQVSLPPNTHQKLLDIARKTGCVSSNEVPKAGTVTLKIIRTIIGLCNDENFSEMVEKEGGDPIVYIEKCVRKDLNREST